MTQATNPGGTVGYGYTTDGLVDTVGLNGGVLADPAYNGWGRMTGVSYPSGGTNKGNATSGSFTIDPVWFRLSGVSWSGPGGAIAANAHTTRLDVNVVDESFDGVDAYPGGENFEYDNAGRLVGARVLERTAGGVGLRSVCYDFQATTGTCGVSPNGSGGVVAGRNSNRVRTTATSVSYGRDASDRVVERKVGSSTVARYSYSAGGDIADLTLNGSSTVVEATLSLPGGVLYTYRPSTPASSVWSYPNLHGLGATTYACRQPAGGSVGRSGVWRGSFGGVGTCRARVRWRGLDGRMHSRFQTRQDQLRSIAAYRAHYHAGSRNGARRFGRNYNGSCRSLQSTRGAQQVSVAVKLLWAMKNFMGGGPPGLPPIIMPCRDSWSDMDYCTGRRISESAPRA